MPNEHQKRYVAELPSALQTNAGKPAKVRISECAICGVLDWLSTEANCCEAQIVVEPARDCPRCEKAQQRSPEIVSWVMGFVSKRLRDAEDAK